MSSMQPIYGRAEQVHPCSKKSSISLSLALCYDVLGKNNVRIVSPSKKLEYLLNFLKVGILVWSKIFSGCTPREEDQQQQSL
jgi:hypothetical protein